MNQEGGQAGDGAHLHLPGALHVGVLAVVLVAGVPVYILALLPPPRQGFHAVAQVVLAIFVRFDIVPVELVATATRATPWGAVVNASHPQRLAVF